MGYLHVDACSSSLFTVCPSPHLINHIHCSISSFIYLFTFLLALPQTASLAEEEPARRNEQDPIWCEPMRKCPQNTNQQPAFSCIAKIHVCSRYMQCIQLGDARHVQRTYRQWPSKAVRPKDGTCRYIHRGTSVQGPPSS